MKKRRGCWRLETGQQYLAAETEWMMKLQDVLLKAMAKKMRWWDAAEIIGVTDRTARRKRSGWKLKGIRDWWIAARASVDLDAITDKLQADGGGVVRLGL
jgi:hypothetical protein